MSGPTYAERVAARYDEDQRPDVQVARAAFEAANPRLTLGRYDWHGMGSRRGEYMSWDTECAWRAWLADHLEA